jgi:ATP-dependent DNA helicase RecG
MALPINIDDLLHGNTVEWDRIELKKGWNPEDILHSLCAFANDINNWDGGYIILGVEEDQGKAKLPPIGLQFQELDAIQKKLIELSHKLRPVYIPVFQPYIIDGKPLLIIYAPAGDNRPYKAPVNLSESKTAKAMYVKRGSKTIKVKDGSEDERRLLELTARIPFDDRINQYASIDDLDLRLIQNYLKEVRSSLYEESTSMSFSDLCQNLRIVKGTTEFLRPTNAGLLMFNPQPHKYFEGAKIELIAHRNKIGKDYIEKIFEGPIIQQIRDVLQFFKANIIEEQVIKTPNQAEAIRFFNYPFTAIEEAIVNAVFHKSYERGNPVEIQIHPDKIEILSFPGPMPPINQAMLNKHRVVARDYRNRKIGSFLKELKFTEGRGTGIPIIRDSLEENGSPAPVFETDHDNTYFLCVLSVHPLTQTILGSKGGDKGDEDKRLVFNDLKEINTYLKQINAELGDQVSTAISNAIKDSMKMVLGFCIEPKSADEIFKKLGSYKNTKNFNNHVKPLLNVGWLGMTIPNSPTSRNQKYQSTELGKSILDIIHKTRDSAFESVPVISPGIASEGYNRELRAIYIKLHHGEAYQYFDVPEKVYQELLNSKDLLAYYRNNLKGKFRSRPSDLNNYHQED